MTKSPSFTETIECRHCRNKAPMLVVGEVSHLVEDAAHEHGNIYQIVSCPACKEITIRVGFWHEGMEQEDWRPKIIHPTAWQDDIPGLPAEVEKEYRAAEQVSHISANAYAVLLGRVLDAVCKDRAANGNTLYERLSDLADRGEIPKNLAAVAHSLRQLRNVGAHADLGELESSEVPVLSALCRAVLEYVYAATKLVEQAELLVKKVKAIS